MPHETFHYRDIAQLCETARALDAFVPLSEDLSCLFSLLKLGERSVENRIAFQPMEGSDGTERGAPGPLTLSR